MNLDKNRSHGKVDKLPVNVREEVENDLMSGKTYEEIANNLSNKGYDVSYSSVGRYGRKYLKKFENVRIAKQFAKLLAEDNVERPPTELHEANNMLMSQIIMETLIDEELDAKGLSNAAKAIATLQNAQVQNEGLKIRARKEAGAIHTAMNILKDKVFNEIAESYPDVADTLIRLASETESELKKL